MSFGVHFAAAFVGFAQVERVCYKVKDCFCWVREGCFGGYAGFAHCFRGQWDPVLGLGARGCECERKCETAVLCIRCSLLFWIFVYAVYWCVGSLGGLIS